MIAMIQALAVGNALRIILEVPAGASAMRLLRKVSDSFTGQDDAGAFLVSTEIQRGVLDSASLKNGTLYFYRAYYLMSGAWVASATVSATPASTYVDRGGDVLTLVRERLDLGLQEEVRRKKLSHKNGHIPVLTAPPTFEDTLWPIVTVHLQNEAPEARGIGEQMFNEAFDSISNVWSEGEGWLARVQLTIMGWSLNPDSRIELRKALRRIVVANLPLFDFAGMVEIDFSQQDAEDFGSYSAPVYQVICTLSCLAPVVVGGSADWAIEDVTTELSE